MTPYFNNNYISIKLIVFSFFFFPFVMHIYWHVFDILYYDNIIYIIIPLLFMTLFFTYYEYDKKDKNMQIFYLLFLVLLCFQTINAVILYNYKELIKLCAYFILFIFIYGKFQHKIYYNLFISMVIFFLSINLFIYFISLFDDFYINYFAADLTFLNPDISFLSRTDWQYTLPFYLSVVPANSFGEHQVGILGLPRFFALSTEPTLGSMVILPTIFMAYYYKRYMSVLILLFSLLLASSYGAIIFLLISIIFYIYYDYKKYLFIFFISLIPFLYVFNIFDFLSHVSPRLESYSILFLNILKVTKFHLFAINYQLEIDLPTAIINHTMKYGLMIGLLYLTIFYYLIKISLQINSRILLAFTISFILMANKTGEIFSPLFLFYVGFILYVINQIKYTRKVND